MRDMASNDPYGVEEVVHGGILKVSVTALCTAHGASRSGIGHIAYVTRRLGRLRSHMSSQPLKLVFRGHLVEFGLNVAYAVSGALLGVPPGEEFRAAIRAAERVSSPQCIAVCAYHAIS